VKGESLASLVLPGAEWAVEDQLERFVSGQVRKYLWALVSRLSNPALKFSHWITNKCKHKL
jgi:hypothetical protein